MENLWRSRGRRSCSGMLMAMTSSPVSITISGYPFDRVAGLGTDVPVSGYDVTYQPGAIGDMNTHVLDQPQTREVSEIGMLPYLVAVANLLEYSAEQGLTRRRLTAEELFHPSTLQWVDRPPGSPER